jgi:periplasmic protein TonB
MKTKGILRSAPTQIVAIMAGVIVILMIGSSCSKKEEIKAGTKGNEPLTEVELMPVFPGGDEALLAFISKNIKYPDVAIKNGDQGKVIIKFCITEKGNIDRVSILKGVTKEIDEESVRVIKTLPRFEPGMNEGKKVAVWYMVPVTFALK